MKKLVLVTGILALACVNAQAVFNIDPSQTTTVNLDGTDPGTFVATLPDANNVDVSAGNAIETTTEIFTLNINSAAGNTVRSTAAGIDGAIFLNLGGTVNINNAGATVTTTAGGYGISFGNGGGATTGTLINNGSITGHANGVRYQNGGTLTNNSGGTITGTSTDGVEISLTAATVNNSGSISGNVRGLNITATGSTVNNNVGGTISGDAFIAITAADDVTIVNNGTLSSTSGGGVDMNNGILTNTGTITASNTAIDSDLTGAQTLTATNSGSISGSVAVDISGDAASVINFTNSASGVITGNSGNAASITNGVQTIENSGSITSTTAIGTVLTSMQTGSSFINNTGGSITGNSFALNIGTVGTGVSATNNGTISITATGGFGVLAGTTGGTLTFNNNGTISCGSLPGSRGFSASSDDLVLNNSATGVITGEVAVSLSGDSTLTNNGTIQTSGTGTVAIDCNGGGNTVNLGTGSNISGIIESDNAGTDVINLTGTVMGASSQITGFDDLNMNGTLWELTNSAASSLVNAININSGTLKVNGTGGINAASAAIASGGTLMGTGDIGTTGNMLFASGAAHKPGNSIGTQTITSGDYEHASGSLLEIEFDQTSIDQVIVTSGNAVMNGEIRFVPLADLVNNTYTFLTTPGAGSVSGTPTISTDTVPAAATTVIETAFATLTYVQNADDLQLVVSNAKSIEATGRNEAEAQLGAILATVPSSATGALADILKNARSQAGVDAAFNAVNGLSPGRLATIYNLGLSQSNTFNNALRDRLSFLHTQATRNSSGPLLADSGNSLHAAHKALSHLNPFNKRGGWQAFASAYYRHDDMDNSNGFTGYDEHGSGINLGVDRMISNNLAVGLGFCGGYHDFEFRRSLGDGDFHGYMFSPYAAYHAGHLAVDANIGYGVRFFDMHRVIPAGSTVANSSITQHEFFTSLHSTYAFDFKPLQIYLTGGLDYANFYQGDFSETGAGTLGFSIESEITQSLKSNLGLRSTYLWESDHRGFIPLLFEVGGQWRYELLDRTTEGRGTFNGLNSSFTYNGIRPDRSSISFNGKVNALINDCSSFSFAYDGEVNNRLKSHTLSLAYHHRW